MVTLARLRRGFRKAPLLDFNLPHQSDGLCRNKDKRGRLLKLLEESLYSPKSAKAKEDKRMGRLCPFTSEKKMSLIKVKYIEAVPRER